MVHLYGRTSTLPIRDQKKELLAIARLLNTEPLTETNSKMFGYPTHMLSTRDGFRELKGLALTSKSRLSSSAISAIGCRGHGQFGNEEHLRNSMKAIPILETLAIIGPKRVRLDSIEALENIATYPERLSKVPTPTASLRALKRLSKRDLTDVRRAARKAVHWVMNPPKLTPKQCAELGKWIDFDLFPNFSYTAEYLIKRVPGIHRPEFEFRLKQLGVDSSPVMREVLSRLYLFFGKPRIGETLGN